MLVLILITQLRSALSPSSPRLSQSGIKWDPMGRLKCDRRPEGSRRGEKNKKKMEEKGKTRSYRSKRRPEWCGPTGMNAVGNSSVAVVLFSCFAPLRLMERMMRRIFALVFSARVGLSNFGPFEKTNSRLENAKSLGVCFTNPICFSCSDLFFKLGCF